LMKICATELRSAYLENDGKGNFQFLPLPNLAQLAPIRAMTINTNGELVAVGNDYATEVLGGRYDAGTGWVLKKDKGGAWLIDQSAISANGDVHSLVILNQKLLVIGSQDGVYIYQL